MPLELARWIVGLFFAYLAIGIVFATGFVLFGVGRIDPAARGATWGFRAMILPGTVALWPLLLKRWWLGEEPPQERNAHRRAARDSRG